MKSIDVKGTARVAGGKKAARELRKQDMVPCNLYGEKRGENGDAEPLQFEIGNMPACGAFDIAVAQRFLRFRGNSGTVFRIDRSGKGDKFHRPLRIDVGIGSRRSAGQ